jgi:hypothetical protein
VIARRLAMPAAAMLLLAACGSSASPLPASPEGAISSAPVEQSAPGSAEAGLPGASPTADVTPDDVACSVLEAAEIEEVLANAVENGVPALGGCEWIGDPNDASVKVTTSDVPRADCVDAFDAAEDQEPLAGLAVPAYWWFDASVGGGALTACLGATQVILNVTGGLDDDLDEDVLREHALELGEIALGRL